MSKFVAINFISCKDDYRERFEQLFATRAHAIDASSGFVDMQVLRQGTGNEYLIISRWNSESDFKAWTQSPAFLEGHRRGFEDMRIAREEGKEMPMRSEFRTYDVISR